MRRTSGDAEGLGGKLEADLTVTKTAEDEFMVVVTDTMHRHAEAWMQRHIRGK